MKTRVLPIFLITALMSACASETPATRSSSAPTKATASTGDESDKPPFIGMSKAQAIARYGEPRRQTTTDEGETWIFVLNFGSVVGKSLIPFYFGGRDIKTGSITFGPDGKVKKFIWDTKTED